MMEEDQNLPIKKK